MLVYPPATVLTPKCVCGFLRCRLQSEINIVIIATGPWASRSRTYGGYQLGQSNNRFTASAQSQQDLLLPSYPVNRFEYKTEYYTSPNVSALPDPVPDYRSLSKPSSPGELCSRLWSLDGYPYLAFIPLNPFKGTLLSDYATSVENIPIKHDEQGWCLFSSDMRRWKVFEQTLRQVAEKLSAYLFLRNRELRNLWIVPETPSTYGYFSPYKTEEEARDGIRKSIDSMAIYTAYLSFLVTLGQLYPASSQPPLSLEKLLSQISSGTALVALNANAIGVIGCQQRRGGVIIDMFNCSWLNLVPYLLKCDIPVWLYWGNYSINALSGTNIGYGRQSSWTYMFAPVGNHGFSGTPLAASEASDPTQVKKGSGQLNGESMRTYFSRKREERNRRIANETEKNKQKRLGREASQRNHSAPGKKSSTKVYYWEKTLSSFRVRTLLTKALAQDWWSLWRNKDRFYNSIDDEWDCCSNWSFNPDPDDDHGDENEDSEYDSTGDNENMHRPSASSLVVSNARNEPYSPGLPSPLCPHPADVNATQNNLALVATGSQITSDVQNLAPTPTTTVIDISRRGIPWESHTLEQDVIMNDQIAATISLARGHDSARIMPDGHVLDIDMGRQRNSSAHNGSSQVENTRVPSDVATPLKPSSERHTHSEFVNDGTLHHSFMAPPPNPSPETFEMFIHYRYGYSLKNSPGISSLPQHADHDGSQGDSSKEYSITRRMLGGHGLHFLAEEQYEITAFVTSLLAARCPLQDVPGCYWDLNEENINPLKAKRPTYVNVRVIMTSTDKSLQSPHCLLLPKVPGEAAWTLSVDPMTALECIRRSLGPSELVIADFLITHGIPFHTLSLAPSGSPCHGLGSERHGLQQIFRPKKYVFSLTDFLEYKARRNAFLLTQPHGRRALCHGGIVARLARDVIPSSLVLQGPSQSALDGAQGFFMDGMQTFVDDQLTPEELDYICGTYGLATGIGGVSKITGFFLCSMLTLLV